MTKSKEFQAKMAQLDSGFTIELWKQQYIEMKTKSDDDRGNDERKESNSAKARENIAEYVHDQCAQYAVTLHSRHCAIMQQLLTQSCQYDQRESYGPSRGVHRRSGSYRHSPMTVENMYNVRFSTSIVSTGSTSHFFLFCPIPSMYIPIGHFAGSTSSTGSAHGETRTITTESCGATRITCCVRCSQCPCFAPNQYRHENIQCPFPYSFAPPFAADLGHQ